MEQLTLEETKRATNEAIDKVIKIGRDQKESPMLIQMLDKVFRPYCHILDEAARKDSMDPPDMAQDICNLVENLIMTFLEGTNLSGQPMAMIDGCQAFMDDISEGMSLRVMRSCGLEIKPATGAN